MRLAIALLSVSASTLSLAAPAAVGQSVDDARLVQLRFAQFDPAVETPTMPAALRGGVDTRLFIVQFDGLPTETRRAALRRAGAEIHGYLPENSYVVRMDHARGLVVRALGSVRAVTPYHPAYRLEPELVAELETGNEIPRRRYNIVVVDKKNDKPALMAAIERVGGVVDSEQVGSLLLEASLTRAQLLAVSRLDQVLWIDRWTPIELDMDNARIQGGANHVEAAGKFTGQGINGHVYEGVEAGHQDFTNRPINVRSSGAAQRHGHCTAGIVFGNGTSTAGARGMAPDAQPFYTTNSSVQGSRYQVVQDLVNIHKVMFTTASWGGGRTRAYTATSASTDDIIFDHGIVWTNSQSNAGNQDSRPEAWAKNIMSIGGVRHRNNSNPLDDTWSGGGSTGPAADGRIKPDLCAYYDGILCSDLSGRSGYNRSGNFYTSFGGTSGATPIVAGHNAIAIQMFTDGLFSPQRVKNGTRWQNKPHFTTLKALQIANASQYAFTSSSTDNRREHCGWGFPNLKTMYDNRNLHWVVDETDVLKQGDGMEYTIRVAPSQPELKASMCYADLAANPSANFTRINDLTLRVIDPNGRSYWGNVGLKLGNYSTTGGARDVRDTVENVFVRNPVPGLWKIEVGAWLVAQDSHVETTAVDADFGLVSVGGAFVSKRPISIAVGAFETFGQGCASGVSCGPCFSENWTQTSTNATTTADQIAILDVRAQPVAICGVDLYMRARSGNVDVNVSIWDTNPTTLEPRQSVATAKVRVSTTLATYSVRFTNRPSLSVYYVVFDQADKLILPASTTGTGVLHSELRNNTWTNFLFTTNWQYRIYCDRGSITPVLGLSGKPIIGNTVRVLLSKANQTTPAAFLLGASNSTWGALRLPWTFAPGCDLLVSGEVILPFVTDTAGAGSIPLLIPNDRRLVGAVAFQQFLVVDSVNSIGLISSNGGRMKVGEF